MGSTAVTPAGGMTPTIDHPGEDFILGARIDEARPFSAEPDSRFNGPFQVHSEANDLLLSPQGNPIPDHE